MTSYKTSRQWKEIVDFAAGVDIVVVIMRQTLTLFIIMGIVLFACSPALAELSFSPKEWDAGELSIGETKDLEVSVSSTVGKAVKLVSIRPSCECITAKIMSDDRFILSLHASNDLNAFFSVFAYVHAEGGETARFDVKGAIKDKAPGEDEIVVFYAPKSADYARIQALLDQVRLRAPESGINEYPLEDSAAFALRTRYEKQYSLKRFAEIEMFAGKAAFVGAGEIRGELERMLSALSTPKPQLPTSPKAVEVLLFHSAGCPVCREIRRNLFPSMRAKFGNNIAIVELDISEPANYLRLIALEERHGMRSDASVSLFAGRYRSSGYEEIMANAEAVIEKAVQEGRATEDATDPLVGDGVEKIKERFLSFSAWSIIGAGLIDGINPCAFATIIFLMSFLAFAGKSRRDMLVIGMFYTLAVFATYLLLGIGVFKVLQEVSEYDAISRAIYYASSCLALVLAALTLFDIIRYLQTKKSGASILQLPLSFKQRIHAVIRDKVKTGGLVIASVTIGFMVSLFESVCTGQVYLPTIALVAKMPELKANAVSYLILYNVMFIVPLTVVFMLAFFGLGSKSMEEFARRNFILAKVLLFLLFAGMGIALLI